MRLTTTGLSSSALSRRAFIAGGLAAGGAMVVPRRRARAAVEDLDFADARAVARAIRRGDVSSAEVVARMLDRIKRLNGKLNAVVTLAEDAAVARAREADAARARGELWGPLHGVPVTIKDTYEVAGVRTTAGATRYSAHVPTRDAAVVARLRGAGAVILGKTNVPPMAADWQSDNPVFGATNNPWDVSRTPGGSTGGGAAALAAGLTYLEPGSDIGGSIRIPAHFCGVYGHKPTLNVVPMRGHIPPPPGIPAGAGTLAVAGPLARSAADLRVALEILGGPDALESRAYRWSLPAPRGTRLADYRIGYVLDHPLCPVSPDVADVLARTVDALRRAGAVLEEGWPQGVDVGREYETYLFLLSLATRAGELGDAEIEALRRRAENQDGSFEAREAWVLTAAPKYVQQANGRRLGARGIWQQYFGTHDAFLLPTAFVPAFPHDRRPFPQRTLSTPAGPRRYLDLAFWISFATLTGLPATTAPVGLTRDGLPVGLQVIGPYLEDATSIDVAGLLADVVGGFRPPPGYA
jgi:amidase